MCHTKKLKYSAPQHEVTSSQPDFCYSLLLIMFSNESLTCIVLLSSSRDSFLHGCTGTDTLEW